MSGFSRRHFLGLTGSAAVAAISGHANAAMGPNDKFDLVIKGGDVLDPSQSLRGKRDIGIRWGVIEAVENEIPAARAAKIIDASGKLVTPGLIDLHSHVYLPAIGIRRRTGAGAGHTTVVSAGDSHSTISPRRAPPRARITPSSIANNGLSGSGR
jgi:dihydroorotase